MSNSVARHRDCIDAHNQMVREVMGAVDAAAKKYDMHPEDYNDIRIKVRYWSHRIKNYWHEFFASVVDAKFYKKINPDLETVFEYGSTED